MDLRNACVRAKLDILEGVKVERRIHNHVEEEIPVLRKILSAAAAALFLASP